MAYPCPICMKRFDTRGALKNHTGTNTTSARKPYPCSECSRIFCSEKALQSHQNAPSHATMFKCGICDRSFGSKQAIGQHMNSESHTRIHAKSTSSTISAVNSTASKTDFPVVRHVTHITPPVLRTSNSSKEYIYNHNDIDGQDFDDRSDEDNWMNTSQAGWDDDQDWALCDKDCGWCGHCSDGRY